MKPELVAEDSYAEVTPDGSLRHPSFEGMRQDKRADQVVMELPRTGRAALDPRVGKEIAGAVGVSRRVVRVGALLFLATLPAVPALLEFARTYNKLAIDASALTRVVSWLRALRIVADHPITSGVADFDLFDEYYEFELADEDVTVLAQRHRADGAVIPVLYAREVGAGRVVYLALGHDMRSWGEPPVRTLVRQALLWASGRD